MAEKKVKTKEEKLEDALKQIEKDYGKGSIMKLGEVTNVEVDVIPTGSLFLNYALGVGGYPRGRIIEVFGPESSGKTTIALHAIAECQKAGGRAAFIDAENAIDPQYAKALGVDIDELMLSQPDSGEQALEIVNLLVQSGAIDIIVIDSVAALVPQAELDGAFSDSNVGLHARMMSKAMRKLAGAINRSNCVVIFINQLREKVGVMFGSPETTTGGRALKFYSTIRLDVRKSEAIKTGDELTGNKVIVKVLKNKVAPPFKVVNLEIVYGEGLSELAEVIDIAVEAEIIHKAGAWFSYNGDKIGQGGEAVKAYLKTNTEIYNEIKEKAVYELANNTSLFKKKDKKKKDKNKDDDN